MEAVEFDLVERHINQLKALMEEDLIAVRQCTGSGREEQLQCAEGTLRNIKKVAKHYGSLVTQLPEQQRKAHLERRLAGHLQDVENYAAELRLERASSPRLPPDPVAWEAIGALLSCPLPADSRAPPAASPPPLQRAAAGWPQDKVPTTIAPRLLGDSMPSPKGSQVDLLASIQPVKRKKNGLSLKRLFG